MRQGFFYVISPKYSYPSNCVSRRIRVTATTAGGERDPPYTPTGVGSPPSSIAIPIRDPCKREEEEILLLLLFEACTTNVHT